MIVHGRLDNQDPDDAPVLVATISGEDLVTLASLTAMQDDYLLWRATEDEDRIG